MLPTLAALLTATAERGAPTGQDSLVEAGDPHFPQPLITDLEAKLDASWEFPNDLRLVGTQELVQLGESMHATATAAAQPQRAGAAMVVQATYNLSRVNTAFLTSEHC